MAFTFAQAQARFRGNSLKPAEWYREVAAHRQLWLEAGAAYGMCLCGCGEPTKVSPDTDRKKGWLKGEPRRFVVNHDRTLSALLYEEDGAGCWLWKRSLLGSTGYGQYKGGTAHRWMYKKHVGDIPEGLDLHHVCGVRTCVNPDHLVPLSRADHLRLHREAA